MLWHYGMYTLHNVHDIEKRELYYCMWCECFAFFGYEISCVEHFDCMFAETLWWGVGGGGVSKKQRRQRQPQSTRKRKNKSAKDDATNTAEEIWITHCRGFLFYRDSRVDSFVRMGWWTLNAKNMCTMHVHSNKTLSIHFSLVVMRSPKKKQHTNNKIRTIEDGQATITKFMIKQEKEEEEGDEHHREFLVSSFYCTLFHCTLANKALTHNQNANFFHRRRQNWKTKTTQIAFCAYLAVCNFGIPIWWRSWC